MKTQPLSPNWSNGFIIASTMSIMILFRIDSALMLIGLFLLFSTYLTIHFRFDARRRTIALIPVVLISIVAAVQYVSLCAFIICAPTSWAIQRDAAQREIDRIAPGFQPVDVWSSTDKASNYRYRTDNIPNRAVIIFFAQVTPVGDPVDAPYLYYSVRFNDRDPIKSAEVTPGTASGFEIPITEDAQSYAMIQISPHEAWLHLNRQLP